MNKFVPPEVGRRLENRLLPRDASIGAKTGVERRPLQTFLGSDRIAVVRLTNS
jgi:hypothetical protein